MHARGGNNLAAPPRFNYQAHTNSDPAWPSAAGAARSHKILFANTTPLQHRSISMLHSTQDSNYWWKWGEDLLSAFSSSHLSKREGQLVTHTTRTLLMAKKVFAMYGQRPCWFSLPHFSDSLLITPPKVRVQCWKGSQTTHVQAWLPTAHFFPPEIHTWLVSKVDLGKNRDTDGSSERWNWLYLGGCHTGTNAISRPVAILL